MKRSHFKGKFTPSRPLKYLSPRSYAIYRSSWERLFMRFLDEHPNVHTWNSESIRIPYEFEDKPRIYIPDFTVTYLRTDRSLVTRLIEIKPFYQCRYRINQVKWKSAREYANHHSIEFQVLTEKDLFA